MSIESGTQIGPYFLERDAPSVEEAIELGIRIAVGIEAAHARF